MNETYTLYKYILRTYSERAWKDSGRKASQSAHCSRPRREWGEGGRGERTINASRMQLIDSLLEWISYRCSYDYKIFVFIFCLRFDGAGVQTV
jgi:hypothetical protein